MSDPRTLSSEYRIARKAHVCDSCELPIRAREGYRWYSGKVDGTVRVGRECAACCDRYGRPVPDLRDRGRGFKAREPERTAEERQTLAHALNRLKVAAKLEQDARAQTDKLFRFCVERGATDHTLSAALGIKLDAARMRRRRLEKGHRDPGRRSGYLEEAA